MPASFDSFGLDPRLLEAVAALGFDTPTAVQAKAIPVLLEGKDVIGGARTGSGKTAAFGLPLLERVKDGDSMGLVLTPTRELALQVTDALRSYAKRIKGLRIVTIYGGAPYPPQLKALKAGPAVVVGTPGRVIDHLDRGSLDLSNVGYFVLDEADEMLRMGFIDEVEKVLAATPPERQVALFSATMPDPIRRVAHTHLNDAVELEVEEQALTVEHIRQRWIRVPQRFKLDTLVRVLRAVAHDTTLVFARTRAGCAAVADALVKRGIAAEALHGDLNQGARERVVLGLRSNRLRVVIATDVAARGIDVEHIAHVINLDLPTDVETYVHRIGRTARAGRKGTAISFVTPRNVGRLERMRRALKVPIEPMDVPSDADIARVERDRLKAELHHVAERGELEGAKTLLEELVGESPFDLQHVAASALQLLADRDRVSLKMPVEDDTTTQLFFPLGYSRGVRPADLVGLLANEADVDPDAIGRITIHAHKSFVGVTEDVAQHVLKALPKVKLRGVIVRINRAKIREEREREAPKLRKKPKGKKPPRPKPSRRRKKR